MVAFGGEIWGRRSVWLAIGGANYPLVGYGPFVCGKAISRRRRGATWNADGLPGQNSHTHTAHNMPNKNKKHKTKARKGHTNNDAVLPFATEGQTYGQVVEVLGGRRFRVRVFDGPLLTAVSRKARYTAGFTKLGDVVLVAQWDFDPSKAHILHRYDGDGERQLRRANEIKARSTADEQCADSTDLDLDGPALDADIVRFEDVETG